MAINDVEADLLPTPWSGRDDTSTYVNLSLSANEPFQVLEADGSSEGMGSFIHGRRSDDPLEDSCVGSSWFRPFQRYRQR